MDSSTEQKLLSNMRMAQVGKKISIANCATAARVLGARYNKLKFTNSKTIQKINFGKNGQFDPRFKKIFT
jgi:hypothetical protein